MAEEILLEVQDLTHLFPLTKRAVVRAVDGVSFQVRRGEIFGLVGESGSGKSTVARCVMNLYRPRGGRILYKGIDVCDPAAFRANRRMLQRTRQMIFQDSGSSLNQRMRVWEIIAEPLRIQRIAPPRGSLREEAAFQMHYVGGASEAGAGGDGSPQKCAAPVYRSLEGGLCGFLLWHSVHRYGIYDVQ